MRVQARVARRVVGLPDVAKACANGREENLRLERRSTQQMLLVNEEQQAVPSWVARVLAGCAVLRQPMAQLLFTVMQLALWVYSSYGTVLAAHAAGLADSLACSARASLFMFLQCAMMVVDGLALIALLNDKKLPSAWTSSKQAAAAAHKSLSGFPAIYVVCMAILLPPLIWWVHDVQFIPVLIALSLAAFNHNLVAALTVNFLAAHVEISQGKFTKALVTGELTYEQAVSDYARVNKERKDVASGLLKELSVAFPLYFLCMGVVLYDFEIRPWGGGPFFLFYVMNTIMMVVSMSPFLMLHDWPEELCAELMEATELAWAPSDKTNFVTLVSTTKVHVGIFDFEMTSGFRKALPLVFFGWWLYMTEIKQFHNFQGIPGDSCGVNATAGGEEPHHG